MRHSFYKIIKRKIRSFSKDTPSALLLPGLVLVGLLVLSTILGFLTKGLIVVGLLLFVRRYMTGNKKEDVSIQGRKSKRRKGDARKHQQKQPRRNIF